jgi:hypothetical protein
MTAFHGAWFFRQRSCPRDKPFAEKPSTRKTDKDRTALIRDPKSTAPPPSLLLLKDS